MGIDQITWTDLEEGERGGFAKRAGVFPPFVKLCRRKRGDVLGSRALHFISFQSKHSPPPTKNIPFQPTTALACTHTQPSKNPLPLPPLFFFHPPIYLSLSISAFRGGGCFSSLPGSPGPVISGRMPSPDEKRRKAGRNRKLNCLSRFGGEGRRGGGLGKGGLGGRFFFKKKKKLVRFSGD